MFDNKPMTSTVGNVPGVSPSLVNRGARKSFHYIEDVFDPAKHDIVDVHKYVVPMENELVFDVTNGTTYRVTHVDIEATLKSTLIPWPSDNNDGSGEQDTIFGVKGGPGLGEALLSIDYSVRPNRARVDSTIMRPGAAYAKLFLGNDVGPTGEVISAQYDGGGNMLGDFVPTILAEIVDRTNLNIMTTGSFSVTGNEHTLTNGKRCTLVFYDEGGNFIPPVQPVMVQHSSYMRDHQIGIKYVTAISLVSPWFANTINPEKLLIPVNVNLGSLELRAMVHYSNGEEVVYPVNGTKFIMHGLQEYRPKYPGQGGEICLTYKLSDDEQLYMAAPGTPNHLSRVYEIQAASPAGAYSPRLYTYPQWDGAIAGYRLQHFLYDLDRDSMVDVTQFVTMNDKSPVYRPNSYHIAQDLIFNLNLRDVDATKESVTFIQHTQVVLLKDKNADGNRFEVRFSNTKPTYRSLFMDITVEGNKTKFNLANGFDTLEEWLEGLYWAVDPSYNIYDESKAPTPTHFDVMLEDGRRWRFPVSTWNSESEIGLILEQGKTVFINWIYREANSNELQLATTGVTMV